MHTYKGYEVKDTIIHDYEYLETALVLAAPCGCQACEDGVQEGHFVCSVPPENLLDDPNVRPRLEGYWFWEYVGDPGMLWTNRATPLYLDGDSALW